MAGAGFLRAIYEEAELKEILDALSKASDPDLEKLAWFMGEELLDISQTAFEKEADPVTGKKWDPIHPRGGWAKSPGSVDSILRDHGILHSSMTHNDSAEGVVFGSHMVYARIHQEGGKTRPHDITPYSGKALHFNGTFAKKVHHPGSDIPARPYMGVPKDFDQSVFSDPAVLDLLGLGGRIDNRGQKLA